MQKSENINGETKRFKKAFSYVDYDANKRKHFDVILFYEQGRRNLREADFEIRIEARNKSVLKKQMRRIENLYPSDKNTITVDLEAIR